MKYFIIRGAGFIGSHLVDQIVENGEVTVYDKLSSGEQNLSTITLVKRHNTYFRQVYLI